MAKRGKRGDGSVHLRKDGRWEGRYVVGRDEKGFPITKNVLAKPKRSVWQSWISCGKVSRSLCPISQSQGFCLVTG